MSEPMAQLEQAQHPTGEAMAVLMRRLGGLCVRLRIILLLRAISLSMALLVGALLGVVLIDYVLRLPMGIRLVLLGGLIWLGVRCWRRYLGPVLAAKISKVDVALRIEEQEPSLRGLVASAVDLDQQGHDEENDPVGGALRAAALATVNRRLVGIRYPGILRLGDLGRSALIGLVVLGIVVALVFRTPSLAEIGFRRAMTPWADVSWPKRFAIVDVSDQSARAADIAVPIRALIGSKNSAANTNARVVVSWRLVDERRKALSDWTKTMLVPQHRRDEQSGVPIYEQLLDIKAAASQVDRESFALEYEIQTSDDVVRQRMIGLAQPPELVETVVVIEPTGYAESIADSGLILSGEQHLSDYDSVISPVLEGSRVRIRWVLSKAVELPSDLTPRWVSSLASMNELVSISQPTPETIEAELIARNTALIEPGIVDSMGIPVRTPITLSMNVLRDQNPGVTIIEPMRDETVSTHAMVELRAQISDDLGLRLGRVQATLARRPAGSSGAAHEAVGEAHLILERTIDALSADGLRSELEAVLDVASHDAKSGDQIWIVASAWDLRMDDSKTTADKQSIDGLTESAVRILRVLGDRELIEMIRKDLGPIGNSLRQLDGQQGELEGLLRDGKLSNSRSQRSLVSQLTNNKRIIDQLSDSLTRNALDDPGLESLLVDSSAVLDEAIKAGEQASERIDRGENQQASKSQRAVRDRIGELLTMLDRGQDSWLALRAVQQLRDDLESVRDDTGELSKQIAGKSMDQLDAKQRSALERILERQLEISDDARDAVDTLDERAKQLEEHDPTQAQALSRAADQGRKSQIEQRLRQAGEQIASNQTSSASQTQSEVLDELEEMLDELENTIQNRDNALRRELASIIESIEGLIKAQKGEIRLLGKHNADDPIGELDDRLIQLSHNTLAVRDDALGAFPETRSIAELIAKSATAQSNAIEALRDEPMDGSLAMRSEQTSLLNLTSALEEANRLDEQAAQRQARRLRAELRDAYRESLALQIALRDDTVSLGTDTLKRRGRAKARALSSSQRQIQGDLDDLLKKTEELGDAPVFTLAHSQLDRLMEISADGLGGKAIEPRVMRAQQSSISILTTLASVLSDQSADQDSDDFDDGSQSGSGSGSGSQGEEPVIPPIAQLELLRSMQELVSMQTRELSEHPDDRHEEDISAVSDLQRQLFEHGRKLIEDMSNKPEAEPDSSSEDAGEMEVEVDP